MAQVVIVKTSPAVWLGRFFFAVSISQRVEKCQLLPVEAFVAGCCVLCCTFKSLKNKECCVVLRFRLLYIHTCNGSPAHFALHLFFYSIIFF